MRIRRSARARWPTHPTRYVWAPVVAHTSTAETRKAMTASTSTSGLWCSIPWSIATRASSGGASAAHVPSTSANSIAATRRR